MISTMPNCSLIHDDVIKWKHFPPYWTFVWGIHRSPVNSPHKGQWRGALMFSLICTWINDWVNNCEAGDLRRHPGHYDVTVMTIKFIPHSGKNQTRFLADLPACHIPIQGTIILCPALKDIRGRIHWWGPLLLKLINTLRSEWSIFCRCYFQMHFLERNQSHLVDISLTSVHKGPIDRNRLWFR